MPNQASADVNAILAGLPFSRDLTGEDRAKLAAIATIEATPSGTVLFREGEPSDAVWILASGRVSLGMRVPGRAEAVVLTLGPGEIAGWSGLQDDAVRVATGRVVEGGVLLRFDRHALRALCDQDADVGYRVMRLAFSEVAARLHQTRLQLLDMFGPAKGGTP